MGGSTGPGSQRPRFSTETLDYTISRGEDGDGTNCKSVKGNKDRARSGKDRASDLPKRRLSPVADTTATEAKRQKSHTRYISSPNLTREISKSKMGTCVIEFEPTKRAKRKRNHGG